MNTLDIKIDGEKVRNRSEKIWKNLNIPLMIMLGKRNDIHTQDLNSIICNYVFGVKFTETIIVIGGSKPAVFTSIRKAQTLSQLNEVIETNFFNKETGSSIYDAVKVLTEEYGVVESDNVKSKMIEKILPQLRTHPVDEKVYKMLMVKDKDEIKNIKNACSILRYVHPQLIDLIRDDEYTEEAVDKILFENIQNSMQLMHLDPMMIEMMFDPKHGTNGLKLGLYYEGMCGVEGRDFMTDCRTEYEIQKQVLEVVKENKDSRSIYEEIKAFASNFDEDVEVSLYTSGVAEKEINFTEGFVLQDGIVFILNIGKYFANTFLVEGGSAVLLTAHDTAADFSVSRMRYKNRDDQLNLEMDINDHQKELLNQLLDEMVKYHKKEKSQGSLKKESRTENIHPYEHDSLIPRTAQLSLDLDKMFLLFPVSSFSVPIHISNVKNVAVSQTPMGEKLRINIKESKELREICESTGPVETKIKSLSILAPNAEELATRINEMKKQFNNPKIVQTQDQNTERPGSVMFVCPDMLVKLDQKTGHRKFVGNLEMLSNGFRYESIFFPVRYIKKIFYLPCDDSMNFFLHFNLSNAVVVNGKLSHNLHFYRKAPQAIYSTSKRESEHMDYLRDREEQEWIRGVNSQMTALIQKIEQEMSINVSKIEPCFEGTPCKETTPISISDEAILSLHNQPFSIIYLSEIEIVVFERVTFNVQTFDFVIVFKDKTRPVSMISTIDSKHLGTIKTILDSLNIVFISVTMNLAWKPLLSTIMDDPIGFYQNGGWSDLKHGGIDEEEEEDLSEDLSSMSEDDSTDEESTDEETSEFSEDEESFDDESDSENTSFHSEEEDSFYDAEETFNSKMIKKMKR